MKESNGRVLVLDDDRALLNAYARVFGHAGYVCITSEDGKEALDRLNHEPVDVVITDLTMPAMSGIEFMQRLRERSPDLPILVVTGNTEIDSAVQSIEARVFRYLQKPVQPEELARSVRDAVATGALARARRAAFAHLQAPTVEPGAESVLRALETSWLALQPIVSTSESRVIAYEALLRINEDDLRTPRALLAAAECLQLLPAVAQTVRNLAAEIIPALPFEFDLFINLHARDLLDERLFSRDEPLFPFARRVVFELTERSSLDDIPDARGRIATLKALGYRIALDDLGAGYAGLHSFAVLEPDFVKVDLTLVRDVDVDRVKQALIRTLVDLANDLNIRTIAEGVETHAERAMLSELGCNLQQGHLFARPSTSSIPPPMNW